MNAKQKEAEAAYHAGNFADAAEKYKMIAKALESSDPVAAAEALNNCSVALLKAGDFQGALAAAEGTEVTFFSIGDRLKQAMSLANQASALEALGSLEKAEQLFQESVEIFRELGETELQALTLKSLSSVQIKRGDQLGALTSMHSALNNAPKLSKREKMLKRLIGIPFRFFKG